MSLKNVNVKDGVQRALREDDGNGGKASTKFAVTDQISQDKLDAIIAALGGSSDTVPTIFNVSVATANTELSQVLPANTKRFIIKARGKSKIQLAYSSGNSNTTFVTIPAGAVLEDTSFYLAQTLYFQTNKAGETVEITAYS